MDAPIKIPDHVHAVVDPDGAVLLDLSQGKYFSLNGLGAEIWGKLQAGLTVPEIERHLCRLYDVPATTLHEDIEGFVVDLQRKDLIRVEG